MLRLIALTCLLSVFANAQEPKDLAVLRYIDLEEGVGAPAAAGKRFTVHYTGWLKDGTKFDSSVDRNEPFQFVQGRKQVITGWDIGFEGMRVGGKRRLLIPYQLAYGEQGTGPIPGKAELTFDVELLDVTDAAVVLPAVDLILPYTDLEAKVMAMSTREDAVSVALLEDIIRLNAQRLELFTGDTSPPADASKPLAVQLKESFGAVRKQMETARNGMLGGDADLAGRATTRRGVFTALVAEVAEDVGKLEAIRTTAGK